MSTETLQHGRGDSDDQWSMTEIVRVTGTTSRVLRHYDRIGLLPPSHTGPGGLRYYDQRGLLRLQRILVLRELGLGLSAIADTLADGADPVAALRTHLADLATERRRLARQISSVQHTITALERGEQLVADQVFDGFDHTQYRDEVEQRWGTKAHADSDRWWRSLSDSDKQEFTQEQLAVAQAYGVASAQGLDVTDERVQAIAERHFRWVAAGWGGTSPSAEAFIGLGEMYVADPRFAANYEVDGRNYAAYVRDAMAAYAATNL